MKKSVVYLFYLKGDKCVNEPYAVTDDKTLADLFEMSRSYKFVRVKKSFWDKKDAELVMNRNQMKHIVLFWGTTVKSNTTVRFSFPLTVTEQVTVESTVSGIMHVSLYSHAWSDISILEDKYVSKLNHILYDKAYNYVTTGYIDSSWTSNLYIDLFQLIVKLLGDYIRI